jgi:hypothetical protein
MYFKYSCADSRIIVCVPPQVQAAMDDWTAQLGGGPQRRDRPQGWRDGQDRYGNTTERQGFARPRGLAAEPYQVCMLGFIALASW